MSMISEQVKRLRDYASDKRGEIADICNEAARTIEELSEKLHAANMERSSAHYHGGWIPAEERLPEEPYGCLVTVWDSTPTGEGDDFENILPYFVGYDGEMWNDWEGQQCPFEVIAWMPLPEPYQVEEKDVTKP